MVPFMLSESKNANAEIRAKYAATYFVSEKPFLEYLGTGDVAEDTGREDDAQNWFIWYDNSIAQHVLMRTQ